MLLFNGKIYKIQSKKYIRSFPGKKAALNFLNKLKLTKEVQDEEIRKVGNAYALYASITNLD